jgi:V/A-type H+-transporting ATPase subunit C
MMQQLAKYSALATKIRYMWGLRLSPDEYRRIAALPSIPEVATYLRAHPRWGKALDGANLADIRRHELEERLKAHHMEEFCRLYHYVDAADQRLLRMPVLEQELAQIMQFLRMANAGHQREYLFVPPPFFAKITKINYTLLNTATSYEDLLAATASSDYFKPLSRLDRKDGSWPEFARLEMALRAALYNSQAEVVTKIGDSTLQGVIAEQLGMNADLSNATIILRVKKFYPALNESLLGLLLPHHHHFSPTFLKQLTTAPDYEETLHLLRNSFYGKWYQGEDQTIEQYAEMALYEFNRKHIRDSMPSVMVPLAFLHLSDVELKNIIHMIECVRYRVSQEEAIHYLVGRE